MQGWTRSSRSQLRALVVVLVVALGMLVGLRSVGAEAAPRLATDPLRRLEATVRDCDDLPAGIASRIESGLAALTEAAQSGDHAGRLAAGLRLLAATASTRAGDAASDQFTAAVVSAAHDDVTRLRDDLVARLPDDASRRGPTAAFRRRVARADRALAGLQRAESPIRRLRIVIRARRVLIDGR